MGILPMVKFKKHVYNIILKMLWWWMPYLIVNKKHIGKKILKYHINYIVKIYLQQLNYKTYIIIKLVLIWSEFTETIEEH